MASRFLRASFALILASAATAAFAQGGGGIGRAGIYPPQFGPGVPSHEDIVLKHNKAAPKLAVGVDPASDVGGVSDVHVQAGPSTATAPSSAQ